MSPGATFERVYNELKRMLADGELLPGAPIEPALIGKQIASSITPIRDALHRLTGERLVEAPGHNGFRVPLPTEAALRDLYGWNAQLLALAARGIRSLARGPSGIEALEPAPLAAKIEHLFAEIARAAGNPEHVRAVKQASARLAPYRSAESRLLGALDEEYQLLARAVASGGGAGLTKLLSQYHRRRLKAAGDILTAILAG